MVVDGGGEIIKISTLSPTRASNTKYGYYPLEGETGMSDFIDSNTGADVLVDEELLEDKVDVEYRADIIETHYDEVSRENAVTIAEILKSVMEGYDLNKREAREKIVSETGLREARATTVYRTERHSIQLAESVSEVDLDGMSMEYSWSTAGDNAVHPVCETITEMVDKRGGQVPLETLVELIRAAAEVHADEGGTPERADHFVGHEECRSVMLSHISPDS
ncbi:hypothetical protein [Halopenitus malekzadehii]|uniref:hypothetical protein n=1 Tax=Halopenitus malekzadehii TaxID=1267564 RepID=UPI00115F9FB7|nr:hypothetical protein [Halopenitus malekzadehii]